MPPFISVAQEASQAEENQDLGEPGSISGLQQVSAWAFERYSATLSLSLYIYKMRRINSKWSQTWILSDSKREFVAGLHQDDLEL